MDTTQDFKQAQAEMGELLNGLIQQFEWEGSKEDYARNLGIKLEQAGFRIVEQEAAQYGALRKKVQRAAGSAATILEMVNRTNDHGLIFSYVEDIYKRLKGICEEHPYKVRAKVEGSRTDV